MRISRCESCRDLKQDEDEERADVDGVATDGRNLGHGRPEERADSIASDEDSESYNSAE